jgi:hypothetical protein
MSIWTWSDHEVTLDDFTILLDGQGMEDFSEPGSDITVQLLLSHLGDEDDVVSAVPFGVRQTMAISSR